MAARRSWPSIAEFKVVLVGEYDVGKSSLFIRVRDGRFKEELRSTIGLDYTLHKIHIKRDNSSEEELIQIRLWDTAGLERTGTLTSNYYKNSHAVILMYDVTCQSTLTRLKVWMDEAKSNCKDNLYGKSTLFFILGNKIDCLSSELEVDASAALNLAHQLQIPKERVFRVSVKTGQGLNDMFKDIATMLSENMLPVKPREFPSPFIQDEPEEKGKCCLII